MCIHSALPTSSQTIKPLVTNPPTGLSHRDLLPPGLSWSRARTSCDQLREAAPINKHFTCLENNVMGKKTEKLTKQSLCHQINSLWLKHLRQTTVTGTDVTWTQKRGWSSPQVCREPLWAGCGEPQAQRSCLQGAAKPKQEGETPYLKVCIVKKMTHVKYSIVLTHLQQVSSLCSHWPQLSDFQFLSLNTTAPGPTLTKFYFWRPIPFQNHNFSIKCLCLCAETSFEAEPLQSTDNNGNAHWK